MSWFAPQMLMPSIRRKSRYAENHNMQKIILLIFRGKLQLTSRKPWLHQSCCDCWHPQSASKHAPCNNIGKYAVTEHGRLMLQCWQSSEGRRQSSADGTRCTRECMPNMSPIQPSLTHATKRRRVMSVSIRVFMP